MHEICVAAAACRPRYPYEWATQEHTNTRSLADHFETIAAIYPPI